MAASSARRWRSALRAVFAVLLALTCQCESAPAFPVPAGPPKTVALDVRLPVYVLGRWVTDGFTQTLAADLERYNVRVIARAAAPEAVAYIDLGRVTYRQWQEVDAVLVRGDRAVMRGPARIHVSDLEMTTLDAAAAVLAEVLARWLWQTT